MQKKNLTTITLLLATCLIISLFSLYKFFKENRYLRQSIPYLLPQEKIQYFSLNDVQANSIDKTVLENNPVSLIIIFQRPCSPCDKNTPFYKKMAEAIKDDAHVYGIVANNIEAAIDFSDKAKLNFTIYAPEDLKRFIETFRLTLHLPQIIVYTSKVEYVKVGYLSGEEAIKIINTIRQLKGQKG